MPWADLPHPAALPSSQRPQQSNALVSLLRADFSGGFAVPFSENPTRPLFPIRLQPLLWRNSKEMPIIARNDYFCLKNAELVI
jgi:hypothetical protein